MTDKMTSTKIWNAIYTRIAVCIDILISHCNLLMVIFTGLSKLHLHDPLCLAAWAEEGNDLTETLFCAGRSTCCWARIWRDSSSGRKEVSWFGVLNELASKTSKLALEAIVEEFVEVARTVQID